MPDLPDPEIARLGRTLPAWRSHVLAYFDTDGLRNSGTEGINMLSETAGKLPTATELRELATEPSTHRSLRSTVTRS